MSDTPKRLDNLRQIINVLFAIGVLVGLGIIVLAIWQAAYLSRQGSLGATVHIPAFLGFLGALLIVASLVARASALVLFKIEGNLFHSHDVLLDVQELLRKQNVYLAEIAENVQLSDATKSIARREKERKALHDAIQEEILRGNWDAAYYLVDELEKRYGYRNEASRLRDEVDSWRGRAKEQRLLQGLKQVEAAMGRWDWRAARTVAAQVMQVFPDDERARGLDVRIHDAFSRRKQQLLADWQESVRNHEMEKSLELLKELDHYLSAEEAQSLREPVRNLFKERLQNLGSQFAAAYKAKDWDTALSTAERIQLEFPTSKMAEEVRALIRSIKEQTDSQPVAG